MRKIFVIILLTFFAVFESYTQIAQFRGPDRNGYYQDVNLKTSWPKDGPEVVLHIKGFGVGYSSPVIYNETIFVTGKKDSFDVVSAYDMQGTMRWQKPYGRAWYASYSDTRNTPTIENNRIYLSSGMGEVICMDAINGNVIWRKNPHKDFKGKFGRWGYAESLLLTDNGVISCVGGEDVSVVALNKENGQLLWKASPTGDSRTYVTPVMIERNGQKLILAILSEKILGINPQNGEIFWTFNLVEGLVGSGGRNSRNSTNSPLYKNGEIFITSGYDADAVMLSLSEDGRSVSLKWKNNVLDTHHGGVVEVDGYIYGSNWHSNTSGNWVCLEWKTGKVMYEAEWINKGQIIYADRHLYCKEERTGKVALIPLNPAEFKVKSSFSLKQNPGPYWSHPAIHNGKLLIRQGEELMVYNIKN